MEDKTLLLVMKFLRQKGYCESLVVLEKQSQVSYLNYGRQIQFLKKIILRGDFNQATKFLTAFQIKLEEKDYKKVMLELFKQKLYELIQNPDETDLKFLFEREIINYCSQQEYHVFFTYLTCKSVHDIPGMSDWTVIKGRLMCFQAIVPCFEGLITNRIPTIEDIQGNLNYIVNYHFKSLFTGNQSRSSNVNANIKNNSNSNASMNYYKINSNGKQFKNQHEKEKQKNRQNKNYQKEQPSLSSSLGHRKNSPKIRKQDLTQLQISCFVESNMNSNGSQRNQSEIKCIEKMGISSYEENKKIDKVQKEPQIELSHSQFQKSQVPPTNQQKPQIAFDKRSKIYADLNPSTLTKHNYKGKFDSSKEIDIELKNSMQHQTKSQVFRNAHQSNNSEIQQRSYQDQQMSQRIRDSREVKGIKESIKPLQYIYKKPSSKSSKMDEEAEYPYEASGSLQEQIKKNIAYLEQNNSVVQKNEEQNQNFTFSNNADLQEKHRKLTLLATISDQKAIRTCQFSQSGRYFALGTNSSFLKIFDVEKIYQSNKYEEELSPIYQIQNLHLKSIFCLQWSSNQKAVVTCSNDLTIRLTQFSEGMDSHRSNVIGRHQSCIRMVKFNNLESKIFSCDDKGLIKIWDLGKVTKCTDLKGHKDSSVSAFKLAQTQNQAILYSVGKDSLIKNWDLRTGRNEITSKKQDSQLTYIANNTDQIVVSHKNGSVSFFNSSLVLQYAEQIHQQQIRSIDANYIDESFITASFDGNISIFNQKSTSMPFYHKHNENQEDKVVYATFLQHPDINGFASASALGLCHLYSYQ